MEGKFQSQIEGLPILGNNRYENIFKLYENENDQFFYNLKSSVSFPDDISEEYVSFMRLDTNAPWTTISYGIYGTMFLWWIITEVNKITNPLNIPSPGTVIKYIKPEYVKQIIGQIRDQSDVNV